MIGERAARFLRGVEAREAWLAVAPAVIALGALAVGPFVLHNNLLGHDLVGHLAAATFTHEHLFPKVFGYNPLFYAGAPQNQLYPPLVAWLAAGLGFLVGVPMALKLLVGAAVLATPVAVWVAARAHGLGRASSLAALAATLYLAANTDELGGTFFSTFVTGNLANGVALPLWLLYAASLARWREAPSRIVLPTFLLALQVTTHLVGGLVAAMLLAAHLAAALLEPERRWERLRWGVLHGIASLGLAAPFAVPLVLRMRYGASDLVSYNQYPDTLLLLAVSVAVLFAFFVAPRPARRALVPLAMLAGALFFAHSFVFNDWFPEGRGIHVHRFKLYDNLLLIVLAVWLAGAWTASLRPALRSGLGWATGALLFGLLVPSLAGLDPRGVPAQEMPELPPVTSRVMVVSSPGSQVSDHAVQHLVALRSGAQVAKGLFVESASQSRFLVNLERLLATGQNPVRAWGILLEPGEALEPLRASGGELLRLFGFGHVLSNEEVDLRGTSLVSRGPVGAGFTLYSDERDVPLAEVWKGPIDPVSDSEFATRAREWFFGRRDRLLAVPQGAALPSVSPAVLEGARVVSAAFGPDGQKIVLDVAADAPVPVLIKAGWFPNWTAVDAQGREAPVLRATPSSLLVGGRGRVVLEYRAQPLDRACGALGLATLGLLLVWAAWPRLKGRRNGKAIALGLAGVIVLVAGAVRPDLFAGG